MRLDATNKRKDSHQVFMNEENPEYAEIQEIRKKVVAAFILKVYGNNVDSLTPNDNIVINSNGRKGNCRTLERNVKCGGYRKK